MNELIDCLGIMSINSSNSSRFIHMRKANCPMIPNRSIYGIFCISFIISFSANANDKNFIFTVFVSNETECQKEMWEIIIYFRACNASCVCRRQSIVFFYLFLSKNRKISYFKSSFSWQQHQHDKDIFIDSTSRTAVAKMRKKRRIRFLFYSFRESR